MPFIEETDLLNLHKDIDKAQILNERLLDQISYKNKELKSSKIKGNILLGVTGFFLLAIFSLYFFSAGARSNFKGEDNKLLVISLDSLKVMEARLNDLKMKNEELSKVREFYLAKEFLDKEKIYSVQIKSFVENNVPLTSNAINNTLFVKTNPFYSYSLGNFKTLEEARSFQNQLLKMGFNDAFVASYQNGKRLKMEDPN
jgi:hypothetical protein